MELKPSREFREAREALIRTLVPAFFKAEPTALEINQLIEIAGRETPSHRMIADLALKRLTNDEYSKLFKPKALADHPLRAAIDEFMKLPPDERGPLTLADCIEAYLKLK